MKSRTIQRPLLVSALSTILLLTGSITVALASGVTEKKSLFKISAQIFVNGKLISKPRITTQVGEEATIIQETQNGPRLKMILLANEVPLPSGEEGIEINCDVEYTEGGQVSHFKPQLVLTDHQPGTISLDETSGLNYKMQVLAEKQ